MAPSDHCAHSKTGTTLLEILVTIGIMSLIVSLGMPPLVQWYRTQIHADAIALISDTMSNAQQKAFMGDQDEPWTVVIDQHQLAVFPGTGSVIPPQADIMLLPSSSTIILQQLNAVTFEKTSGTPSATGTFLLTTFSSQTQFSLLTNGVLAYD